MKKLLKKLFPSLSALLLAFCLPWTLCLPASAYTAYKTVSFGATQTGQTVTYSVLDNTGTPVVSGVSGSVVEIGGGTYGAAITVPDGANYFIKWSETNSGTTYIATDIIAGQAQAQSATAAAQTTLTTNVAVLQTTATAVKAKTDLIATNAADSPNQVTAQGNAATTSVQTTSANQSANAAVGILGAQTTSYQATGSFGAKIGGLSSGGGSAPTTAQIAAAILSNPANLLATDSSGKVGTNNFPATVVASSVTGNVGGNVLGGVAGDVQGSLFGSVGGHVVGYVGSVTAPVVASSVTAPVTVGTLPPTPPTGYGGATAQENVDAFGNNTAVSGGGAGVLDIAAQKVLNNATQADSAKSLANLIDGNFEGTPALTGVTNAVNASGMAQDYQQRGQPVTLPATVVPTADVTAIVAALLAAPVFPGVSPALTYQQAIQDMWGTAAGPSTATYPDSTHQATVYTAPDGTTGQHSSALTTNSSGKAVSRTVTRP